jgi:hypothetical protein
MMALVSALLAIQTDPYQDLQDLRRTLREKSAAAATSKWAAHEALDRGDYDVAATEHRKSKEFEAQAAELRKKEERLLPDVVAALVRELMDDRVETRDRAAGRLVLVGQAAARALAAVQRDAKDAEVRARVADVLGRLGELGVDEEGRLRQWASAARASSEYGQDSWGAKQACGKPNTAPGGDAVTAWASQAQDADEEWLELTYAVPVRPSRVRVHETFNPGAVCKIEAQDPDGKWVLLWQQKAQPRQAPAWLEAAIDPPPFAVRVIRLTLDSDAVAGWNEIDAVELIGEETAGVSPAPKR